MKKISVVFTALALWGLMFSFASAAQHALGTNTADSSGTVFTITTENNQTVKRPYTSAGAFLSYSFNTWSSVTAASPEDLALPTGSLIPPQDGKVFCSDRGADKGTCYLITSGQRAGFTSADVFNGLGYSFNNALYGDVSFLNSAANISTATTAHQPGTLINKEGTVYLVGKDGLVGVPNPTTLQSWGYAFTDVVPANAADRISPISGQVATRQPGQLSSLNITQTQTAVPAYSQSINNDAKRLADIRQLASVQELYLNDHKTYPKSLSDLTPTYIGKLPVAPVPPDGSCTLEQNSYNYSYISANNYNVAFCLGGQIGGYSAGVHESVTFLVGEIGILDYD